MDYINRKDAMTDVICEGVSCQECPFLIHPVNGGCKIEEFIKAIPAADVAEVIRCKDCVYFIRGNQEENCFPFIEGEICNLRGTPYKVNKDAYCSFAERREE